MSTADDRLFAAVLDRLEGDSTIQSEDAAVVRDDWQESQRTMTPRIEYNSFRYEGSAIKYEGVFGITIYQPRANAYGPGDTPEAAGTLENLETAVLARLAGWTPTVTDHTAGVITLARRNRTHETPDETAGRRLDFRVLVIPGTTSVPTDGSEADFVGVSVQGEAIGWRVDVEVSLDEEPSDYADETPDYGVSRKRAWGYVDFLPYETGTPFPAAGGTFDVVFTADATYSWTDTVLIRRHEWVPNPEGGPQFKRLHFVVTNSDSPFFGAAVSP